MLGLIQVVTKAHVEISHAMVGNIDKGIVALVGLEKTDTQSHAERLIERILNYRIFPDSAGKMNLSLSDIQGGLLLVPQFTLVAETHKGLRPGFSSGMPPDEGKVLFDYLVAFAQSHYSHVAAGVFGAYMKIHLCNEGPTTFLLKI